MNVAGETTTTVRRRRDEAAVAVFGTWMIFGLFLDGWAHQANKPETFFSPWHGVLYSGFVAAVAWFAWDGYRSGGSAAPGDRWMTAGLVLFVTGAVGDGLWHEIFGIEVDLEALLSPTHLLLLIGGFLMVTAPLRFARSDVDEVAPTWPMWWPQAVTLTLATSLVGFFSMYLSAFESVGGRHQMTEELQAYGVAKVLATNLILVVPTVLVLHRWDAPRGTFLLLYTAFGVLMTGLDGFVQLELAIAPALAGAALEVFASRRARAMTGVAAGSLVLWCSFFAIVEATSGVAWTVELWSGSIVLATASSALVASVGRAATDRR